MVKTSKSPSHSKASNTVVIVDKTKASNTKKVKGMSPRKSPRKTPNISFDDDDIPGRESPESIAPKITASSVAKKRKAVLNDLIDSDDEEEEMKPVITANKYDANGKVILQQVFNGRMKDLNHDLYESCLQVIYCETWHTVEGIRDKVRQAPKDFLERALEKRMWEQYEEKYENPSRR
jgi:hypothetical protein